MISVDWKEYDPSWLVELATLQYPSDVWLHDALRNCTKIKDNSYFVDPIKPNEPESKWQFKETIMLESSDSNIVLDILKDGNVGSVEVF